ncbi:Transmembrane protein 184 homolog C30D11,06c [Rhizoctonia solani AG-1 IB]|uniref:Transmembrane protein 184 homolog C30D11,06c n=1 Tax=Thanatephorus cucumeris (strain AG1-IB / isolate 7/3/14) TaxID=1108050 RepID=M5BWI8_THACB|nr:Transmembrane protein 184 homolog C30D11,06c [Rhizoctonia solani AG-1 IB]
MAYSTLEAGSGSGLSSTVLVSAGLATVVATVTSVLSICSHPKNYRKPALQRMVIRIMVMVPLYAISSFISLFSLEAGVIIDVLRDIYEAFVIYCFFHLLLIYLGGERSLLILLYGREPKEHAFPVSIFKRELDASDQFTFLFLRRGILQYVQVKPILAAVTLILKALGKYREGSFRVDAGYLYVSMVYNASVCLSLYCLAMFWVCVNTDLKPFRYVFISDLAAYLFYAHLVLS